MNPEHSPPPTQPRAALSDCSSTLEADHIPLNRSASATPTPERGRSFPPNCSTPATPAPERGRSSARAATPVTEPLSEVPLPDDGVFQEYKTRLRSLTTLATFRWDAEHSEGTFVPIP